MGLLKNIDIQIIKCIISFLDFICFARSLDIVDGFTYFSVTLVFSLNLKYTFSQNELRKK